MPETGSCCDLNPVQCPHVTLKNSLSQDVVEGKSLSGFMSDETKAWKINPLRTAKTAAMAQEVPKAQESTDGKIPAVQMTMLPWDTQVT